MSEGSILLNGLDGSNPLAFLAALGTLRTLTLALPDERVTMNWELTDGAWRPRVCCAWLKQEDQFIELLDRRLERSRGSHATRFVGDHDAIDEFYTKARQGYPIDDDQWVSALVNDVHPGATSPIQTTRRDYFPGNIDQILANTDAEALRRTLFRFWRYEDTLDGQSLHLEPSEDRRHAYQWNRPSGDPDRKKFGNMLGANRLAIEALPLFMGVPSTNPERLAVVGWSGVRSDNARWTWPVWRPEASLSVVRSLLSFPELQEERPNRTVLVQIGVVAAFRSRRILVEKTPNLSPAVLIG